MSLTHKAHHPSVCMSLSIHIYDSLRKLNCLCVTCIWGCNQTGYRKKVAWSRKCCGLLAAYSVLMVRLWMKACSWDKHRLSLLGGFSAVGYSFSLCTIASWRPSDLEVNEYAIKRSSMVYHRLSLFDVTAAQGCHHLWSK